MIKLVDSGQGLRLLHDDVEIFNHTAVLPFIKYLKGDIRFSKRKGCAYATFDTEGEFAMNEYEVLSASINSAKIKFTGFNDVSCEVTATEEKKGLSLYFNTNVPTKLQFISGVANDIIYNGTIVNGQVINNITPTKIGLFDKVSAVISYEKNQRIIINNNKTMSFITDNYAEFDFSKKTFCAITFAKCPNSIVFTK